jgi:hypothetical protein
MWIKTDTETQLWEGDRKEMGGGGGRRMFRKNMELCLI